jgi:hypothetical protein
MRSIDPCPNCGGKKPCRGRKPEHGFLEPSRRQAACFNRMLNDENAKPNNYITSFQLFKALCLLCIFIPINSNRINNGLYLHIVSFSIGVNITAGNIMPTAGLAHI